MPGTTGGRTTSGTRRNLYRRRRTAAPYDPGKRRAAEGKKQPNRGRPTPSNPPYTPPAAPSEKTQSPKSAPKSGSNPTGRGRAPSSRAVAGPYGRQRQRQNAAQTRRRVRRANARIRREKRQSALVERQIKYQLGDRQPGPYTDLERAVNQDFRNRQSAAARPGATSDAVRDATEAYKKTPKFQRGLLRTRGQRLEREAEGVEFMSPKFKQLEKKAQQTRDELKKVTPDTDTHIGPFNVEAELEGRGIVHKVGEKLKKNVEQHQLQSGAGELGAALGKDAIDMATMAVPGAFNLAAGAVEGSKGDWGRLAKFAEDVKDTSTLALLAQGRFGDALEQAKKHPGFAAAELYGAGAGVSRGAGAAARHGGRALIKSGRAANKRAGVTSTIRDAAGDVVDRPGDARIQLGRTLHKAGRTQRKPKRAPGTTMYVPQSYSKGLARKGYQVHRERVQKRNADALYAKARRAQAKGDPKADTYLSQARREDPFRMSGHEIKQHIDVLESISEPIRARQVNLAVTNAHEALTRPRRTRLLKRETRKPLSKPETAAAVLAAQRIITHKEPTHRPGYSAAAQVAAEGEVALPRLGRSDVVEFLRDVNRSARDEDLSLAERSQAREVALQLGKLVDDPDADYGTIAQAALDYAAALKPGQRALIERAIAGDRSSEMATLIPYAVRHMGARWDDDKGALVAASAPRSAMPGSKGARRVLSPETIRAHAARRGIDPEQVGFVTANPGVAGTRGQFFRPWQQSATIRGEKRKGGAFERGTLPVSAEEARGNAAMAATLTTAFDNYSRAIAHTRFRGSKAYPGGKFDTFDEAAEAARSLRVESFDGRISHDFVPVPAALGRKSQAEALIEMGDDASSVDIMKAGLASEAGDGPWVLIPRHAQKQMQAHLNKLGGGGLDKAWKAAVRQFRGVVLTLNLPWAFGNATEATFRSALVGAGPKSQVFMRDIEQRLAQIDPASVDAIKTMIGHGEWGMPAMKAIYSTLDDYRDMRGERLMESVFALANAPGAKQVGDAWRAWTEHVFGINGRMEHGFRQGMAGRYALERFAGMGRLKLTQRDSETWATAVEQAANGLRSTSEQIAMANWVRKAYGQYEAYSPGYRWLITHFTPFLPWMVNALYLIGKTIPKEHPAFLAANAIQVSAQKEWFDKMGLGYFVEAELPNWLQGSVPVAGGWLRAQRFTPFSAVTGGVAGLAHQLLPQFSGAAMAAFGLDWKGEPIAGYESADEVPEELRWLWGFKALAQASVPGFTMGSRTFGLFGEKKESPIAQQNPIKVIPGRNREQDLAFSRAREIEKKRDKIREDFYARERAKGKSWPKVKEAWEERRESFGPNHPWNRLGDQLEKQEAIQYKTSHGQYGDLPSAGTNSTNPLDDLDGASDNPLDDLDGASDNPLDDLD